MSASQSPLASQTVVVKDKYVGSVPGCAELARRVPGLLPVARDDDTPTSADMNLRCEFSGAAGAFVEVDLAAWKSDQDDPSFPA
ncbi:hypothetical protein [Lentzea sp. NPDC059081]|uniref:hypothetical protein n=1 Tax=Lentzea sp. NPDC059081 TaxID=3346719 RepID=UPI0036BB24F5